MNHIIFRDWDPVTMGFIPWEYPSRFVAVETNKKEATKIAQDSGLIITTFYAGGSIVFAFQYVSDAITALDLMKEGNIDAKYYVMNRDVNCHNKSTAIVADGSFQSFKLFSTHSFQVNETNVKQAIKKVVSSVLSNANKKESNEYHTNWVMDGQEFKYEDIMDEAVTLGIKFFFQPNVMGWVRCMVSAIDSFDKYVSFLQKLSYPIVRQLSGCEGKTGLFAPRGGSGPRKRLCALSFNFFGCDGKFIDISGLGLAFFHESLHYLCTVFTDTPPCYGNERGSYGECALTQRGSISFFCGLGVGKDEKLEGVLMKLKNIESIDKYDFTLSDYRKKYEEKKKINDKFWKILIENYNCKDAFWNVLDEYLEDLSESEKKSIKDKGRRSGGCGFRNEFNYWTKKYGVMPDLILDDSDKSDAISNGTVIHVRKE